MTPTPGYRRPTIATLAAAALLLAACSGQDEDPDPASDPAPEAGQTGSDAGDEPGQTSEEAAAASGGSFTIHNCEPRSLNTGAQGEVCGGRVMDQLFSGLTTVDYDTGEVVGMVATDWETEDAQTWTFTLRDDFTFHNGDPVTAQTFVDTWNWIVNPENAQEAVSFFDKIEGYTEVTEGGATELSGVSAPDDTTLEITLTEPFSPLPSLLSYTAFYPLPEVAFEDINAFQEEPIGNGRYMMDGAWEHDVQISMVRYEDWPGEEPGVAERIQWRIYSDLNTAYLDAQAGELDILSGIPPERLPSVDSDFAGQVVESASSSFTYLGMPMHVEGYDHPDVRHALSMAIDRPAIIETVFNGSLTQATGVIPPVLPEYRGDACQYCEFDPEAAAELYEAAGGPSELTIWYNSGAGHEEWTEAVANMWQQHLPIDSVTFESLEFAQYLDLLLAREVAGPFRLGWVLSYPSPQYAMEPIYTTDAPSNNMEYSNPEFDELITAANAAADADEAASLYQEAEDVLLEDMPVIPMWYGLTHTVHSQNVGNVIVDPRTYVRVEAVQVNG
ncbi:peptide ABC transporter substrate-binding protein [Ornithinimicrobium sufpigmenti]|uniref:peptide ABC transporter substrate-binding protein n=1 Tax=Ornithinimicrobium sufpigmenti TaxID=2508882 RepID=UPI001035EA73|nr:MULTISPECIES: ABC transporter substrate-binding protein [unclassified Ornithinimicrobium]